MRIVQEIQTDGGQTALLPALTFSDERAAESAYHQKLAAAAVSAVDVHTVIMYDEHGNIIRSEYYEHA